MQKSIIRLAIFTVLVLLIPLGLTIRDGNVPNVGWNWSPFDFVWAFVLIFGIGLAYLVISKRSSTIQYRAATGLGLAGAFLLVWVNGAVGIIGDSDINMLYGIVLAVGFFGAIIARFKPHGMAYTLFAAAIVQFAIPVIAFVINEPDFSPGVLGVFVLNFFWVMMFTGSGMLFWQAAGKQPAAVAGVAQ